MLAKAILAADWPKSLRCLDLGCGLGLPGIAALARGMHVCFSDADPMAADFATHNARLNGFFDLESCVLDWHAPPPDVSFPLILASDLLYEPRNHEALFRTASSILTSDGELWLCDPDRKQSPPFFDLLRARAWNFTRKVVHAGEPGKDRIRGYLYKITRPTSKA
jgi:predicted nicotinamide N-methyase